MMGRVRDGFGAVSRGLVTAGRVLVASPRLFAALTIAPVLVAYVVVTAIAVPLPDLVVDRLTTQPRLGGRTDRVVLTLTVRNGGGSAVPASVAYYYLQRRPSTGSFGQSLGQQRLGVLSPGQSATTAPTFVLPRSVTPGSYRLLACVAPAVPTSERNVRNNCRTSAPFQITKNDAH